MSAAAFWSDVAECRRLLRHYAHVRREVLKQTPRRRVIRTAVPWALIVGLALPWWEPLGLSPWYGLFPLLLFSVPLNSPRQLTTFEALHMPSRRALFVARLMPYLPWWIWIGLWGTAGLLMAHRGQVQGPQEAVLWLAIGAQLPGLVLGCLGMPPVTVARIPLPSLAFGCFLVPVWLGIPIVAIAGNNAVLAFRTWLPLIPAFLLVFGLALLAVHLWALERMEPMQQMQSPAMNAQAPGQVSARKAAALRARQRRLQSGTIGPVALVRGRHGLGWAAVVYALEKFRHGGTLSPWRKALAALLFPVMMFWLALSGQWWIGLVMLFVLPFQQSILHIPDARRLYLLGVDFRAQLVHFLMTFWLTPPLLLSAVFALLALAFDIEVESAMAFLALVVSMTLLGGGWYRWPDGQAGRLTSRIGCCLHVVHHLLLALWLAYLLGMGRFVGIPLPAWTLATRAALFAAACGTFGLAGILYHVLWLTEARLRNALLESEAPSQGSGNQPAPIAAAAQPH